jgi:hydrogenase expression/formation protein HypE
MGALPAGKVPAGILRAFIESLPDDPDVLIGPGIGRDAAAVRVGDEILVFKSDPITFPTDNPGWYLVNINANDIACMGATPRWLLVTALLPAGRTTPDMLKSLFSELRDAAAEVGCSLIGGHTEITEGVDRPILIGQMIGATSEDQLVNPSSANPDDAVVLIGGIAIEGTAILANEAGERLSSTVEPELLKQASSFARNPGISVLSYAQALMRNDQIHVRAMHDPTEGGLATGIREVADATGLGISIDADQIFVYPETTAISAQLGIDPLGLIASGALLVVVPEDEVQFVLDTISQMDAPVARIGTLTSIPHERTWIINGETGVFPDFAADEIARYFSER